ncbi:hypothetical protein MHU86_24228 [Fragilaria crotonensis]|nr:hypothetical protein MHU86_24228 [Fragilaria crotonensis]
MISTTTSVSAYLRNSSALVFPCVYTATIMTPNADGGASHFAAEVDLLSYTQVSKATSQVSFLVHNLEELTRLRTLATQPSTKTIGRLKIDSNTTSDFRKQMDYIGTSQRVTFVYSTISNFPCYKNLLGSFAWMDAMVARSTSIPGLSVSKTDIGDSYLKDQKSNFWVGYLGSQGYRK